MTPGDKTPYTGDVDLISGELGDDFTYYLAKSEQIPSAVGLSVFVEKDDSIKAAGGFMVQVMPGASDEAITKLETAIQGMPRVSDLLWKVRRQKTSCICCSLMKNSRCCRRCRYHMPATATKIALHMLWQRSNRLI